MTQPITVKDAIAGSKSGDVVVVDLRETAEIAATGATRGALRLPLSLLPLKAAPASPDCPPDLAAGKPIALYCAAGARAARAKDMLEQMGYTNVHNIGGFAHWAEAGGDIDR